MIAIQALSISDELLRPWLLHRQALIELWPGEACVCVELLKNERLVLLCRECVAKLPHHGVADLLSALLSLRWLVLIVDGGGPPLPPSPLLSSLSRVSGLHLELNISVKFYITTIHSATAIKQKTEISNLFLRFS